MLKRIIKSIMKESGHRKYNHYSSSDYKKHRHSGHHGHYGHHHYKKKHRSGSFFSSFFSS